MPVYPGIYFFQLEYQLRKPLNYCHNQDNGTDISVAHLSLNHNDIHLELCYFYNLILDTDDIPHAWKKAQVVPRSQPGTRVISQITDTYRFLTKQ